MRLCQDGGPCLGARERVYSEPRSFNVSRLVKNENCVFMLSLSGISQNLPGIVSPVVGLTANHHCRAAGDYSKVSRDVDIAALTCLRLTHSV